MEAPAISRTGTDPPISTAEPSGPASAQAIWTELPVPEQIIHGIRQYAAGNILGALWNFFEAAADDPGNPLSHYLCGLALQALGMNVEARDEWEKVIRLTRSNRLHTLTSDDDSTTAPSPTWVRSMAQQLLAQHSSDTTPNTVQH